MTFASLRSQLSLVRLASWLRHDVVAWRCWAIAFTAGVGAGLAMAPLHMVPLFFVAACVFIWQIIGASVRSVRRVLSIGWWFGFGFFACGIHWIGESFLVDADRHAALAVPAILALCGGLALFFAAAAWLLAKLARGALGWRAVLGFAVSWTLADWLRGTIFTGFPWNLAGHIWGEVPAMLQFAAGFGIYGLGFLTCLLAGACAMFGQVKLGRADRYVVALIGLFGALVLVGGAGRLAFPQESAGDAAGATMIRVVQPNIGQREKWQHDKRANFMQRLLALSADGLVAGRKVIIVWPETAVTYDVVREEGLRRSIAAINPGGVVVTGALRWGEVEQGQRMVWNSLFVIGEAGEITAQYDKSHLVPFGEYTPAWFPFRQLAFLPGWLQAGRGPVLLVPDGVEPFSPLICYEAIFPGAVVARGVARPQWLVNITNDAWFGTSFGPAQHFLAARIRSIEEGLALVRSANTGISGVIDPYGRILGQIPLGRQGVLDIALPRALSPTWFSRYHHWPLAVILSICTLLLVTFRAVGKEVTKP